MSQVGKRDDTRGADGQLAFLALMDVAVAPNLPPGETGDYFSPLKLFEYMAMKLPVVCSRSGQMADIIRDGENGLLFTPGSATELAEKLSEAWALVPEPDARAEPDPDSTVKVHTVGVGGNYADPPRV